MLFQQLLDKGRVDQWIGLWEKVGEIVTRAGRVNLDRKQVILSLLTDMAKLAAK